MRGLKRLLEKLPKLSHEQLGGVLRDVADENAMLTSIFDSLSTGLIIVDRQIKPPTFSYNKTPQPKANSTRNLYGNPFLKRKSEIFLKKLRQAVKAISRKNLRLPAPTVQCTFYLFLFFHM